MKWVPILGEFEILADRVVFKGRDIPLAPPAQQEAQQAQPEAPRVAASIGILLGAEKFVNGSLHATVEFDEPVTPFTVCELIVGYDVATKGFLSAGLGGDGSMFSLREWVRRNPVQAGGPIGPGAWTDYELIGDRANLRAGVKYELQVHLQGSALKLEVNDVEVAVTTLRSPSNQPRHVGLFCISQTNITVTGFSVKTQRPKAFIVMQFSSPYNEVYAHAIKDICEACNVDAVRADEIYGPGIIIKDVVDRIAASQVVIADISPPNPNVYFEVGYALALGKPIILLAQRRPADAPLPFDVSSFRVLFYDDSIGGKPQLETGLRKHLQEILGKDSAGSHA